MPERKRLSVAQGTVRHAVRATLQAHTKPGQKLLLAVSGGADSLALASATVFVARKLGRDLAAVVVDHGLQRSSGKVALQTKEILVGLGIQDVVIKKVSVKKQGGPEAAARSARYQALEEARVELDADFILLGHTSDDQAETVLLGLVRGSGARSLSGMSERNGTLLRPLLGVERATTVAFCEDENLKFWSDPQNRDESFLRVRVRLRILPFLEKHLGPGITKNLIRTSDQLREDDDYLSKLSAKTLKKIAVKTEDTLVLETPALVRLEPAMRNRVIKSALDGFGVETSRTHVLAVADLVMSWHGQKKLALPGVRVERKGAMLIIKSNQES